MSKTENFNPYDRVLVRDSFDSKWKPDIFGFIRCGSERYSCLSGCYRYCIPYEGNCHLIGTALSPEQRLPMGTPVMVSGLECGEFRLRFYCKGNLTFSDGLNIKEPGDNPPVEQWTVIIPFDKFNPNDIAKGIMEHNIANR